MIFTLIFGPGCGEDEKCETADHPCGGQFTACCKEDQCYYLADDGTRFNCDGTDCLEAAQELANYMCDAMIIDSPEDYEIVVEEIHQAAEKQKVRRFFR
jgi:hypothetical protein